MIQQRNLFWIATQQARKRVLDISLVSSRTLNILLDVIPIDIDHMSIMKCNTELLGRPSIDKLVNQNKFYVQNCCSINLLIVYFVFIKY